MPYLEVLNGPEVGYQLAIFHDTTFVGRDPNNHLILTDRTVSRKHAVINLVDAECTVTDLQSLKGLLVNGVKKAEATLENGDELTFGAVRVRFHAGAVEPREALLSSQKNKRIWLVPLLVIFIAGGGYYWLHSRSSHEVLSSEENSLEKDYEQGIALFNQADFEGAKKSWQEVIKKDPKLKTVYAQKASKLLQNLP